MTIRHLNTFITVCELQSISKAAEKLNVAQPAVSQTISELEKFYGVHLFKRINNRIYMTPDAESLSRKAREIIKSFNEFNDLAKSKEEHPSLVIGTSITVSAIYLSSIIKTIKEKYPNVNLSVKVNNALEIQSQIENGIIDFAIIEGKPSFPNITYEILENDELVVVSNYEYKIPKQIDLSDLTKYPLLIREKGSYSRDYLFQALGIDVNPMLESNSNQAIITSCIEGAGIAFLPKILVNKYLDNKQLKTIKINKVKFSAIETLIWHEKREFSQTVNEIINQTKDIIKNR